MALQKPIQGPANADIDSAGDPIDEILQRATPRKQSRARIMLWLIALSLLVFFVPLYLFDLSVNEDAKGLSSDLSFIQNSLTLVPTPVPAVQKVLTPLAQAQAKINQLNAVNPTIEAPRPDWPAVMRVVGNYNPDEIALTSISQTANTLTITGHSIDDNYVTTYANSLNQSGLFSRVVIQSMRAAVITPTAMLTATSAPIVANTPRLQPAVFPTSTPAPAATSIPTTAATSAPAATGPTATPAVSDPCQHDSSQPLLIALAQPQPCVFYVVNDVDNVGFLAKGGHYYHIYTTQLAPGVDTYIALRAGSFVLSNDDAATGSLYSDLLFQNSGPDTNAVVTITNRGIFGSDKAYAIVVEEVLATPAPAPTNTPLPAPTRTPLPTATSIPSPTATPNVGDGYETDNTLASAKPIYIGQTQAHTFSPTDDVDNVKFPVKQGHNYQVLTSNLALGVDTFVTVTVNGQSWWNDDYTPGSGNFASSVCFPVTGGDYMAYATVANKAGFYGSDKTYSISVNEIPSLSPIPKACAYTTPLPVTSMLQGRAVPGLAAPIRSGSDWGNGSTDQSSISDKYEFVIIADIKIEAP